MYHRRWGVLNIVIACETYPIIILGNILLLCAYIDPVIEEFNNKSLYFTRLIGESLSESRPFNSGSDHWDPFVLITYLFRRAFPFTMNNGGNYCTVIFTIRWVHPMERQCVLVARCRRFGA